ncbi:Nucleolar protein 58 [Melanopsichium pennsylvanicum]|uniref:Nucleolar protein 58 n=2 Tax=Melanopsichium pennsylvanicum TaxID=63383 RepID=A0AAJ5C518_9BASI|nr:probable NOP58-required for pre-18S rRNA processing [Melanopsichium pennsylvanicum 4]SNX84272.1 Nucleolar protein 58 [Melanopsichium pennsylvanicum]
MVKVLFETAVGFCLFNVSDSSKLESTKNLHESLDSAQAATNLLKLSAIHRFTNTAEAVEDISAINEGKMSKSLKKFLTDEIVDVKGKDKENLIVAESKLASNIAKKLGIQVTYDSELLDLYRGIRENLATLLSSSSDDASLDPRDLNTMSLGLSHSLSRYKLKFSPDKVDTMVVQAIGLLDDLDKEINIYAMRVKEWYGWHFPEMGKIITDNLAYSKVIRAMGFRTNASATDFSEILPEEIEETLKAAAEISMGTEISETDLEHIWSLCDQVISITQYRTQLYQYLQNRMAAIAPNLTALVGDLVGARLISHAGSLMNLAKHPASTVQILGAEKALFRALKTKHDTPKYGLIYHTSLVGQAPQKLKGKMARMVATKASLSIRLDALADAETKGGEGAPTVGIEARAKLESRLRALEMQSGLSGMRSARNAAGDHGYKQKAFQMEASGRSYNAAADGAAGPSDMAAAASMAPSMLPSTPSKAAQTVEDDDEKKLSKEQRKALKKSRKSEIAASEPATPIAAAGSDAGEEKLSKEERKALKKAKKEAAEVNGNAVETPKKEKKDKKKRSAEEAEVNATPRSEPGSSKKKKSKKD